jgi:hypothetical protein
MADVLYTVSQAAPDRLHVEAHVTPDGLVTVLSMRESYGPASGFAAGIANLAVEGAHAAIRPGTVLVTGSQPFTLSYDCVLPTYRDARSLLRGFRQDGLMVAPGMALFHRLHGAADYEVRVKDPAGGRAIVIAATALERCCVVVGELAIHPAGATSFVHAAGAPFAAGGLIAAWPQLARAVAAQFGEAMPLPWTVLLVASAEHAPGRPGAGFSLPGGALVSIRAEDASLAAPSTLWLLAHELSHQWLGEAIHRANPADDWFFEGFADFAALAALRASDLMPRVEVARLLAMSLKAVRNARAAGEVAPRHQGVLLAWRWHRRLAREGRSLAGVLAALIAVHRGTTLGGEDLLTALAEADRCAPSGVSLESRSNWGAAQTPSA